MTGSAYTYVMAVILGVSVAGVATVVAYSSFAPGMADVNPSVIRIASYQYDVNTTGFEKFSSGAELREFLADYSDPSLFLFEHTPYHPVADGAAAAPGFTTDGMFEESVLARSSGGTVTADVAEMTYSTTNIQVAGVDEPDFVKSDGRYVYVLTGNELGIIDAYPAEDAEIVFESDFDVPGHQKYENMFLNRDRIAVIYDDQSAGADMRVEVRGPTTGIMILDVTDRHDAEIIERYSIDGRYQAARMIGDHIYVITHDALDQGRVLPGIWGPDRSPGALLYPDAYYFDGTEYPSEFTTVTAIDIMGIGDAQVSAQTYILGSGDAVYVSEDGIYLTLGRNHPSSLHVFERILETGALWRIIEPLPEEDIDAIQDILEDDLPAMKKWGKISHVIREGYGSLDPSEFAASVIAMDGEIARLDGELRWDMPRTAIHKIAVDDSSGIVSFEYVAGAEVAGRVLNQFSMDEHGGMFRIATTVPAGPDVSAPYSSVYVLDERLDTVGRLEGIAPGESIYSARFAGEKLYMVTFRQIDPFFVIDLSGGTPRILGELKIPGFSDYLHPYGEDHIIGIGRSVGEDGRVRDDDGVKVAMFDVSDFSNPRLSDELVIGGARSSTPVQDDHRAVLIDESKGILSLPIQHDDVRAIHGAEELSRHGGLHAFHIYGLDSGRFDEKGTVPHGEYSSRSRSLYIGDMLYTVTDGLMMMNPMSDITRSAGSIVLN